jgi:hypothetical protein
LTSHTPGGRRPETVAASVSDRLAFPPGFGRAAPASAGARRARGIGPAGDRGHPRPRTRSRGDQNPWKERAPIPGNGGRCTDSSAEQRPEVDRAGVRGDTCSGQASLIRLRPGAGGEQRQEGNGRGDAVRLPTRSKPSKGHRCGDPVGTHLRVGSAQPPTVGASYTRRLAHVKRSEPHVRHRDATSPGLAARRKPPRW